MHINVVKEDMGNENERKNTIIRIRYEENLRMELQSTEVRETKNHRIEES